MMIFGEILLIQVANVCRWQMIFVVAFYIIEVGRSLILTIEGFIELMSIA